jgi:hypothetical protein
MAKRSYRKKSGKRSKRSPRKGSKRSGRRTKRRSGRKSAKRSRIGSRKIKNSPCAKYKKDQCGSVDPNCGWVKKRGCSRKRGAATKGAVYEGPSFQPFAEEMSGPPMRMRKRSRRNSRR